MPTLGSSSNPSWAGWIEHGFGWIFGCKYTTPAFDILVTDVAAYFNTYQGNGAHGWLAIFKSDNTLIWRGDKGIVNNGTLNAGGQQWWTWSPNPSPNVIIPAGTVIWICGYCDQNIVFSTYDTSPQTYAEVNGGSSPGSIGAMANQNQGPCGAYLTYSQVVKSSTATMGSAGGGLKQFSGKVDVKSGVVDVGSAVVPGGGLAPANSIVTLNTTALMGSAGSGVIVPTTFLKIPMLRVWRSL